MLPMVYWLVIGAVCAGLVVSLSGEVYSPEILPAAHTDELKAQPGPFSFEDLHVRLPPRGVERISSYIRYFQTEGHRRMVDGLARGGKYLSFYKEIFREKGMPEELAYLPLIESGFVSTAVSPAAAAGIWQFIEETGARYNLQRTAWHDKRFDPFKSARAAASLLNNLYKEFNNWELALAAYNCGARTVAWAIRKNVRAGKPVDFWALDLPEETMNYVPNFMAAVLIIQNPGAYGFDEFQFEPTLAYEHLKVSPGTVLGRLASDAGISLRKLRELNPELIRGAAPPGDTPYKLRVPMGLPKQLMKQLVGRRPKPRDWLVHPLSWEDTLEELATRFRAEPQKILKANGLENAEELFLRTMVIIPL